jgi:predicted PurR-regulated permease PerM
MNRDLSVRLLFVLLLAVVLWSAYQVVVPFAVGFTWAAVLVVTFSPFHARLERMFRGRRWMASTVVTVLVAAFIVVPLVIAAVQAVQGGVAAYGWILTNYQASGTDFGLGDRWPWLGDAYERATNLAGFADADIKAAAISGVRSVGGVVADRGPALVGGAFGLTFSFLVMIVGMPVFFSHGRRFSQAVADALPIPEADATRILGELHDMTRTLMVSVGLTSAVQAALGGIALFALGVPYALPLTAAMFFFSLLPPVGTGIVWLPAAIWLAYAGHPWKAVILFGWGAGVVSTIDNVLRPLLAGKGVKLSGILLFLGMFGGMAAFGLMGLFLGPIALYMAGELVAILRRDLYGQAGSD